MHPAPHILITLAQEIRPRTLAILNHADPAALLWTPKGTANHLTWHAGHALWVQDAICIVSLTGTSNLPPNWTRRFGMDSQPAADPFNLTNPWPTRETLVSLLAQQLEQIESALAAADPALLLQMESPHSTERGIGRSILHGLHDEAMHQGEMRLLIKLWKASQSPLPPQH